jgi:hypothetical protein
MSGYGGDGGGPGGAGFRGGDVGGDGDGESCGAGTSSMGGGDDNDSSMHDLVWSMPFFLKIMHCGLVMFEL